MRKTIYFLLAFVLLTTGCSKKTDFVLKGRIDGLSSDTLLVFYQLPEYKLDTLICKNGEFKYTIQPDTLHMFSLILNEETSLPIFAQKEQTVEVSGRVDSLHIAGEGENKRMNEILTLLRITPEQKVQSMVDSLIRTNTHSFTNLYLIEKYYAHRMGTNYTRLKELIEGQSGILKDTPYITSLLARIEDIDNKSRPQNLHSLYGIDRNGNELRWSSIRNKYILVDFWASWHPQSKVEQDSLESVLKALRKEKFQVISVSLDMDKEAWLEASDRDTTQWMQICDFKGWNNTTVRNQGIHTLPYNILLDTNKRIVARNIHGQKLVDKVKQLIKEDKEREARRKKNKR